MRTFKTARAVFFMLTLGIAAFASAPGAPTVGVVRVAPAPPVAPPVRIPVVAPQRPGMPNVLTTRHVLLGSLPALPTRSEANTMRPSKGGRVHPMAANGDSITVSVVSGCGGNQGQIYAVGCQIQWQFNEAVSTGADQLEDCYAPNNQPSTVANCSAKHTGSLAETTTLNATGNWVFGTLDTTTGKWLAVIYLPVGTNGVYLDTFSDQFDVNESGQFTATAGTDLYIEATGLTSGAEKYEVYVEYTSAAPYCIYTAPAESPAAPLTNALCNPSKDAGNLTTASGTLQVSWPLLASYPSGTYSIVLWDVTANQRLAEREVSIIGSSSGSLTITPAGGNASPNPAPAGTPGAVFAYDGQTDDSDNQLTFAATGLGFSGQITLALSDPTGQVQQTYTGLNSNAGTFGGQSWNIQSLMSPANYPFDTWTATITNSSTGAVLASKSFRMVGYAMQTEFTNPVTTGVNLSATTQQSTTLQFTNTGASVYGSGNGDPISAISFSDGTSGVLLTLGNGTTSTTGVCAGALTCQTETLVDSNGVSWSLYNYCLGSTNKENCTIYATPLTAGQALANGASLTIPNLEYIKNSNGANCTGGCPATTTILPQDGQTWSSSTANVATNPVYFTEGNGTKTYAATGDIYLYGYRDAGNTLHTGEEAHGYTVRAATAGQTSVTYTSTSPSTSGTAKLVYAVTVTNNSTGNQTNISDFQVQLPSAFSSGISGATIDATSPTAWLIVPCSGAQANTICFQQGSGNNNGIVDGATQTLYLDIAAPTSSFAYTDASMSVTNPSVFGVTADGSWTEFAGPTPGPNTVDSTALVGYSLNSTYMTAATSPQSVGQNVTQNIGFTVTNTSLGLDANPDYLDAVIISVPTTNAFNTFSVTNTGWSELGSYAVGSNTYYVFGLCAAQDSVSYEPPNNGMLSCGQTTEQADAIGPGGSLNFTANLTSGASNVAMTMYAHGANGNGWSAGKSFSETVTTTSLDAGFSAVGASPPPAVANGSLPTVGADASATLGNYYVYTLQNTSSTGASNNITSMTITVPGQDTSGANGADGSNKAWTITGTPTLSGSGFSGCSVTSYTSATAAGANGSIVIGGASCALTPGGVMNVNFTAQAPYKVNDTYRFTTSALNGATSVPVVETWTNDTEMEIVLSAALTVTIDPATNANAGTNPSPNCAGCTFTMPATIDMGGIANLGSVVATDVVEVDVSTDASSPEGWKLYVDTSINPSNTGGTYTNELVTAVDSAHSLTGAGVSYDQTSLVVMPTTSPGLLLLDTGSGTSPRRSPFGSIMDYEIYINGGPTSAETATVTYTFIPN